MYITMERWSQVLNECGKLLAFFTSMTLETHIFSNGLDPLAWEAGGTVEVFAVIESIRHNPQKDLARLPDLVCSLESKLMINENYFSIVCFIKEINYSLKILLGKMFWLILVKYLLCWAHAALGIWRYLSHWHAQIILVFFWGVTMSE